MTQSISARRGALGLGLASGVLYFVGFCGFDQFYLSWICLVPILWALDDPSLGRWETLLVAWFFGLVTHLGGYTWIAGMLQDFGHLPLPLALGGYFLLCLGQGSLLAAWGWVLHYLVHRVGAPILWTAPVVMVLAEWLWPALFPSYLSNSQYRQISFIQSLEVWGPLGLTFILALSSAVLYETAAWRFRGDRKFPVVGWMVTLLLVGANLIYGVGAAADIDDTVAHAENRLRVGIVQTNMGIYQKDEDPGEGLRRHREQSLEVERLGAELIVWPESGYNWAIREGTPNVAATVLGPITTPLLFGGMRLEGRGKDRELYNSAFLTDGGGYVLGTYDKTYLLAFGEYLPFGELFPWLYDLSPHTGKFNRGQHTDPLVFGNVKYGVLICYEDILPGFVRKVMQQEPHLLVNITNDAWFGRTREPLIHLALATFRSVENRRFLIRATNTGISAIVDPAGRIIDQTPIFARANLVGDVTPLTIRTIYSRFGDVIAYPCLLAVAFWLRRPFRKLARRIKNRRNS